MLYTPEWDSTRPPRWNRFEVRGTAPLPIGGLTPLTICRSVRTSVCPVHCGKTAARIHMPFDIIGRTGPGMRQVMGFGDRSTGSGTFGANLGRAIVINGHFTAYVCESAATVGAAVWGSACSGPRHCCIRWRSTSCKGKGRFGGFCFPFSQTEMPLGRLR